MRLKTADGQFVELIRVYTVLIDGKTIDRCRVRLPNGKVISANVDDLEEVKEPGDQ